MTTHKPRSIWTLVATTVTFIAMSLRTLVWVVIPVIASKVLLRIKLPVTEVTRG